MNKGSIEEATKHLINQVKNLGDQNPIMKEWSDQVLKNFDQWRKDDWFDKYQRKENY